MAYTICIAIKDNQNLEALERAFKGKIVGEVKLIKRSPWNKGKRLTDEHKRKIGFKCLFRKHSEEWKRNHSDFMRRKALQGSECVHL